jgi:hypothetical protein
MSFNFGNSGGNAGSSTMQGAMPVVVPMDKPLWVPMPTTSLKEARLAPTLEVFMNVLTLGLPERQLLQGLMRLEIVERTHHLLRTTYAFDNSGFAPRGEHGPFERLTQRKMHEYIELSLRGKGVEFSWDRIVQNTEDLARIAFVLSERIVESNLYAAMTALARNEVDRLKMLNNSMYTPILQHAYRMMSLNLQPAGQRNVRLSESATFLDGGVRSLYLPPGAENMWGSNSGPMVVPVRGTLNDDLRSPFQQDISMGEYMRFPDFLDNRDFTSAHQRDMDVYDHANQTEARLSFLENAKRAVASFAKKEQGLLVSDLPGFKDSEEVRNLYGRSKLVAAGLPLESSEFVLLLELAKSKNLDWKGVTETLVSPTAPQVGDDVARSIASGAALWSAMFTKFRAQSKLNQKLGTEVSDFFGNVRIGFKDSLSIQNVAAYVGEQDSLLDLNDLIKNKVNLPIDLIVVRREVQIAGALVILTNGQHSVTVYTSRPLAGTTPDASNQTTVATISFANGAVAEPNAVRNVMLVRGGIFVRHITGGGVSDADITPILVAPGTHINDYFPMTGFAAKKLSVTKPDFAEYIDETTFFDEDADDLTKMIAQCAVRSAYAHTDRKGRRVVKMNARAPAHLISPFMASYE